VKRILLSSLLVNALCLPVSAETPEVARLVREAEKEHLYLEYEKALKIYNKVIQLDPDDSRFWARRGTLHEKLGKYELAVADYTKSLKMSPSASIYRERAQLYWKWHKPNEAIADFGNALKIDPTNVGALRHRCHILRLTGRYKEAIIDGEKAMHPHGKIKQDVYLDVGESYMKLGKYEKAAETYTKLIGRAPDLSGGYYGRAAAYEKLGKVELARKDKQTGIECDGSFDPNAVSGKLRR